jgi:hypothetical protein
MYSRTENERDSGGKAPSILNLGTTVDERYTQLHISAVKGAVHSGHDPGTAGPQAAQTWG